MLRLEGIKLTLDERESQLTARAAARLRCRAEDITEVCILRKYLRASPS